MHRTVVGALALSIAFSGCGDAPRSERPAAETPPQPSGERACALLMQTEVDDIFGAPVGNGTSESLEAGVELCTWPAGEDPALLLQIGPTLPAITAAVELGEGYRTVEIAAMSGPAALSVEIGKDTVAVLAMTTPEKTVTLSPIGLGIPNGSERLETLKSLLERVASRSAK